MSEFQMKLLRLLTVGLTFIGSLGLTALAYRFHLPYANVGLTVAVMCAIYLAGSLVIEFCRWQLGIVKQFLLWDELAAPRRTPVNTSQPS
jgi:hypothetical protein